MKKIFLFAFIFFGFITLSAQKTEDRYLSGYDKDHTVQWDFFCTNGRNSGKWSKIAVPSNWELQGFGSYLYGKTNMAANEKGLYKYKFAVNKTGKRKRFILYLKGQ